MGFVPSRHRVDRVKEVTGYRKELRLVLKGRVDEMADLRDIAQLEKGL